MNPDKCFNGNITKERVNTFTCVQFVQFASSEKLQKPVTCSFLFILQQQSAGYVAAISAKLWFVET